MLGCAAGNRRDSLIEEQMLVLPKHDNHGSAGQSARRRVRHSFSGTYYAILLSAEDIFS